MFYPLNNLVLLELPGANFFDVFFFFPISQLWLCSLVCEFCHGSFCLFLSFFFFLNFSLFSPLLSILSLLWRCVNWPQRHYPLSWIPGAVRQLFELRLENFCSWGSRDPSEWSPSQPTVKLQRLKMLLCTPVSFSAFYVCLFISIPI